MRSRKVKIVLLVIAILIITGVVLVHIEFSHTGIRNSVTSVLSKVVGMPVRMEKLSLKLSQGIKVKNLSLGDEDEEILSVEGIILKCNFIEMLRKKFNVRSVVVEKPILTLQKDKIVFLLLPLVLSSHRTSPGSSNFQFQPAKTEIHNGEVTVESGESGSITVDEIELEISSEGKGSPVNIKADGKVADAFGFSIIGSYSAGEKIPANFEASVDIDLDRMDETFSKLNLKVPVNLKGTGKSTVNITLNGGSEGLNLKASTDLTENALSYADIFNKPIGFPAKVKTSASVLYSEGALKFSTLEIELGKSILSLDGTIDNKGELNMDVSSDSVIISELAKCIPALKNIEMEGEAKLDFKINKTENQPVESSGRIEVKNLKYSNYSAKFLTCNIKNKNKHTEVRDIAAIVGEGRLTGSGEIFADGKYKFSLKGENLNMEEFLNIKKNSEVTLEMSGKARMQVQVSNNGGGAQGLNGAGSLEIQNGMIKSFSWIEDFFSMIHLPELMPFKYAKINGSFNIKDGKVDIAETTIRGRDAVFATEEGEIDLVSRTKNISADFALAPHLVKRQRAKFREFDKFFYVDKQGYAHLSLVWKGSLSKGAPDLTASIIKTGIKKYGTELLEKLFEKDKKRR